MRDALKVSKGFSQLLCIVKPVSLIWSKYLLQLNIPATRHLLYNIALRCFFYSLPFFFLSQHTQMNNNKAHPKVKCIRDALSAARSMSCYCFGRMLAVILGRTKSIQYFLVIRYRVTSLKSY